MLFRTLASRAFKGSKKVPLRLVLVVPFVLQIFAAVGLTGYFSLRNGEKAVNDLATQLRSETTARIQQHIHAYLATPHLINQINADAVRRGQLKIQDLQTKRYLWQQIQSFDSVTSIYYAAEQTHEFMGVTHRGSDRSLQIAINDKSTGYRSHYYSMDSQGKQAKLLHIDSAIYNPRIRPWYKAAVRTGKPIWSKIYPDFVTRQLTITASQPVYDHTGAILGVCAVDFFLKDINQFLGSLKIGQSGQTFIMERSGLLVADSRSGVLVANSTPEQLFIPTSTGEEPKRIRASDSSDAVIQSTAQYLAQYFGDFTKIQTQTQLDFIRDSDRHGIAKAGRHFVQVTPFQDSRGLDWLIVVVVPEADFMERIHASTRTTILLCLGALVLAILLGLLTSRWITKPILRLSRASEAMSRGELDQKVGLGCVEELGVMAESFNRMAQQLRESFTALENTNSELEVRVEQLKQTQLQLVQSEKMSTLGQLVAGVAHEINNPVGFIAGNLSCAQQYIQDIINLLNLYQQHYPNPDPEIREQIEIIDLDYVLADLPHLIASMKKGTDCIGNISTSLRAFSRADSPTKVAVDLHQGLDSTLMILKYRLNANSNRPAIQVIKKYGFLPQVECYPGQLNQVFVNIIANAIDAFEEYNQGRSFAEIQHLPNTITISTTVDKDSSSAVIRIKDNGPGMLGQVKQQVFDYLFTTKPIGQGTGLGLSISRQIVVEKHGGHLTCISSPGEGTEFVIEIPIY